MLACGVDTMMAPDRLRRWEMLSWASPVPGGMSMTITSKAPQLTLLMKVSIALITMGPRHTAALSSFDTHMHLYFWDPAH